MKALLLHNSWLWMQLCFQACSSFFLETQNTEVHVVFMNHLDVGFDGISPINGFSRNVVNKYFQIYYPRAVSLAHQFRNITDGERFVYTTHSYLVSLYLQCPPGMGFYCPSSQEMQDFKDCILNGEICWHAFPFNAEPELMYPNLFKFGVQLSQDLGKLFTDQTGKAVIEPKVMSQRDVPGMTKAVIPHLKERGVIGISVGVNSASMFAEVPKLFRWRFSEEGYETSDMLVAFHPGGYGGVSRTDCAEVVLQEQHVLKVLCYAFRGDNAGPPENTSEVLDVFKTIKSEYAGATIVTKGGFESFFESVLASPSAVVSLPIIDKEIGDTWIYGVPSEPFKTAMFRAWQSVYENVTQGENDAKFYNFSVLFLKNAEHTWGGDTKSFLDVHNAPDYYYWSNQDFDSHHTSGSRFSSLESSWVEQRQWGFDYPLQALGAKHSLYQKLQNVIKEYIDTSTIPDLSSFEVLNPYEVSGRTFIFQGRQSTLKLMLNTSTGAINSFMSSSSNYYEWAGNNNTLGEVWYQTFTEDDVNEFIREYVQCPTCEWALLDFGKKGLNATGPQRQDVIASLRKVYIDPQSRVLWVELAFPSTLRQKYGAPSSIFVKYFLASNDELAMDVIWRGKRATRMPESISVRFNSLHSVDEYLLLDKLGRDIAIRYDGSSVIKGGSQHLHGINSGVQFVHPSSRLALKVQSLDAAVVCLGQPTPFPTVAGTTESTATLLPDYDAGLSFNLFNNLWGTNYVMWYPFNDSESLLGQTGFGETQGFRFKLGVVSRAGVDVVI